MKPFKKGITLALMGLFVAGVFSACSKKKEVPSTSGGGSSTQSVLTVKGAGR